MIKLGKLGGMIQEGSLYVLLFLLPFSIAAVEVTFGVLLLGWMLERIDPATRTNSLWCDRSFDSPAMAGSLRIPPRGASQLRPLLLAVVIFLAVCALSIPGSDHPSLSLNGFVNKWLEYLLFFLMTADVGKRPGMIKRGLAVLSVSSFFVIVEGLTQEIFGKGVFRGYPIGVYGRMTGPYHNPIDLATYFMVSIPILLMFWARSKGWRRIVLGMLLLLLIGCFVRTEASGAWLGLCAGLIVMMANKPTRRYGLVVIATFSVWAGVGLYHVGRLQRTFSTTDIGTVDRWHVWQAAVGMIKDRPLLGHGLNTFMANYLKYWVGGERMPRYAHNCYLQMAAEAGLVGLAAFLWLLWVFMARLVTTVRRSSSEDSILLAGFAAGLLAFLIHSAVDTNFYSLRQAALFWVVAGLAVGLSHHNETSAMGQHSP